MKIVLILGTALGIGLAAAGCSSEDGLSHEPVLGQTEQTLRFRDRTEVLEEKGRRIEVRQAGEPAVLSQERHDWVVRQVTEQRARAVAAARELDFDALYEQIVSSCPPKKEEVDRYLEAASMLERHESERLVERLYEAAPLMKDCEKRGGK